MLDLSTLFGMYPFMQKLFADGGYQGPVFQKALAKALPHLEIEIVKRSDHAKGFEASASRVMMSFRLQFDGRNWESKARQAILLLPQPL